MTYLLPLTRVTTVSGVASARSIRSGFSAKSGPPNRLRRITVTILGVVSKPIRGLLVWPNQSAGAARDLSRPGGARPTSSSG